MFKCTSCGRDILTQKCQCGQEVPRHVADYLKLPRDKPDWLKEMERQIYDP